VPEEQDMGEVGMTYAKCERCGKETRLYVKVFTKDRAKAQNVCYQCRMEEFKKALGDYKEEDWEREARDHKEQEKKPKKKPKIVGRT
jgi:molybdopterin synthase catalytic subunit